MLLNMSISGLYVIDNNIQLLTINELEKYSKLTSNRLRKLLLTIDKLIGTKNKKYKAYY